ncbi:MAG: glycoside hydrolase family 125 protein, partial [Proteobacteria bacterium]|nr:glycoside hydrolase family 125 protein [Pseudomonadota bacterium]
MNDRRDFLKLIAAAAAYGTLGVSASGFTVTSTSPRFASKRPPPAQRKFTSQAVESELARVKAQIGDPKLAWLFGNCYPNTLDTTVHAGTLDGKPDTFIVTGDIDAMWLRDSSAQVWPYLPLAKHDDALRRLYRGLIHRHARCIAIDPYANAFMADPRARTNLPWALHDDTDMQPGVAERKWEIDSLCWTVRLAHGYWQATGDRAPFDDDWRAAMRLVLETFRTQQRRHGRGPYHFQRSAAAPTDTLALGGYGWPGQPVGLIFSMFRPSDDACKYPLFVPGNAFAAVSLRQLGAMTRALFSDEAFARDCEALAEEVQAALEKHALMRDAQGKTFWAYEVDGYGNQLFMDDA